VTRVINYSVGTALPGFAVYLWSDCEKQICGVKKMEIGVCRLLHV